MAETIGTAYIQIEPSFQGVNSAIEKEMSGAGESGGRSFGGGFAKVLGGTGKAVIGAAGLAAGAITAVGGAFINASNGVAEYGDDIDKMSQKMGLSAESYQEWEAVMQHSGTSMESMKASMKTLANAAETGKDAFQELGISQEQIANMSQEELFEATIAGLQNVEDTTQRTYLAGQLLGRGATELGALLNTSAEDTQAMRDRVHELGGVMSDDAVKAAAAYQDQLQDMQTAFGGLSRNMLSEFLPSITQVMGGLTEIFSGNSGGVDMINSGIDSIIQGITNALPQIMEIATSIIESLATALLQNLPKLAQCALEIVTQLLTFLVANLPLIITTVIQLFIELVNAVVSAIPQIIEALVAAMPQIIDALCDGLIVALPALIQGAVALVTALVEHLPEIIMALIQAAPQILTALATAILTAAPILINGFITMFTTISTKLVEWGAQLISQASAVLSSLIENAKAWLAQLPIVVANFVGQMIAKFVNLLIALPGKAQQVWSQFMSNLKSFGQRMISEGPQIATQFGEKLMNGLKSIPSKIAEVGKDIVEGLKNGIKNAWTGMTDWIKELADSLIKGFKDNLKIGSPSKVFRDEIGRWIPAGIAEGIEDGMGVLDSAMADMTMSVMPTSMEDISTASYNASNTQNGTDNQVYNLLAQYLPIIASGENVNVTLDVDGQRLFRIIQQQQARNTQLVGVNA